jgi:hypothetical protein
MVWKVRAWSAAAVVLIAPGEPVAAGGVELQPVAAMVMTINAALRTGQALMFNWCSLWTNPSAHYRDRRK